MLIDNKSLYTDSTCTKQEILDFSDDAEPQLCRSKRVTRPPERFGEWVNVTQTQSPVSVKEALSDKDWQKAMQSEITSMKEHEVWNLEDLPPGKKVVKSK